MSSKNLTVVEKSEFITRFIDACGTSQPAEIARLLNISYQAAKNYLQGRMPDTNVLISLSEQTPYSIHWLVTGVGEKFVQPATMQDKVVLSDEIKALIMEECLNNVGEILSHSRENAQEKVIVLRSEDIKDEKVIKNPDVVSKQRQ